MLGVPSQQQDMATAYSAVGGVTSFVFYQRVTVSINEGKSFQGNAGGLSTFGPGTLFGHVYTDDLDELYKHTVSFQYTATPIYVCVVFFNKKSQLLGHFQAAAVSAVTGVGGGSGKWC